MDIPMWYYDKHPRNPPKQKPKPPTPHQLRSWGITLDIVVQESSESENPYLQQFASSPLAEAFLMNEAVISSFGRRGRSSIRKELIEAASLEAQIKKRIKHLDKGEKLVIWDICCGKGYSSVWLSMNTFPNAQIFMVDKDPKINRDYLSAFPNLKFYDMDVYSPKLQDMINMSREIDGDGNRVKLLIVGIHLCGDLSRRALELKHMCQADAVFVSPCCAVRPVAPRKRQPESFGYDVPQRARKMQVAPYAFWCWMLWGYAKSFSSSESRQEQESQQKNQQQKQIQQERDQQRAQKSVVEESLKEQQAKRQRVDLSYDPIMKTDKNQWLVVVDQPADEMTCRPVV